MASMNYMHNAAGVWYVCCLVVLTAIWSSPSLLVLTGTHVVVVLVGWFIRKRHRKINEGKNKDKGFFKDMSNIDIVHFHLHREDHVIINIVHISVVASNMLAYLMLAHNEMPPSTMLLPETMYNHEHFGTNMYGRMGTIADRTSERRLVQLAQKGFYYAEEYTGTFGTAGKTCTPESSDGWKCYAVGVMHFLQSTPVDASRTVPRGISGSSTDLYFYQPLPTPAYKVEVQVRAWCCALSCSRADDGCDRCTGGCHEHDRRRRGARRLHAPAALLRAARDGAG